MNLLFILISNSANLCFTLEPCVKNAYFNGRVCKCKTGFKGQGYRRCTKQKVGRNLEEEEKRDVSDDDMDINENGLETV